MSQPWGLSGPQFIALYIAVYLAALVIVFTVQAMLVEVGSAAAGTDAHLDVYQTAYLAAGPNRVVNTAVAALVLRDQVLVARGGQLTAVRGAMACGPVEAAVCAALTPTASRAQVLTQLRHHPAIESIGGQVRAQGLMFHQSRMLPWRLVLFVPVVVWFVGLVRAINGAALNRPIGNLAFLLMLSGIASIIVLRTRFPIRNHRSAAGRSAVRRLREQHRFGPQQSIRGQIAGVALRGLGALADSSLRRALVPSSGSSGDGGGGGGGCGGGGGGCGG